jgi:hypothetical protein
MPRFTFHLEDSAARTPEFVIDDLPDTAAAFDFARRLMAERLRYGKVEIVQDEAEIGVLTR